MVNTYPKQSPNWISPFSFVDFFHRMSTSNLLHANWTFNNLERITWAMGQVIWVMAQMGFRLGWTASTLLFIKGSWMVTGISLFHSHTSFIGFFILDLLAKDLSAAPANSVGQGQFRWVQIGPLPDRTWPLLSHLWLWLIRLTKVFQSQVQAS